MRSSTPSGARQPAADWNAGAIYALAFLTLISSFNYLDRSILGLALPSIKAQMHVSDTALGLVSGLAFVIVYSIIGLPIAWLADRASRRNIIAIGFAFWSLMTVVTGFVSSIWQLAWARLLMGAGEACAIAPSNSMLSDLFRSARRPLVLAIFGTANSIAFILFYPLVGWIGDAHGWRAMFIVAGLPGVILAIVFALTVREPTRGATEEKSDESRQPALAATLRFLAGSRAYLFILLGATFMGANVFAASAWNPMFLSRVHGLDLTTIAASLGPIRGVLGAAGILIGGILVDRYGRRSERWRLLIPAVACILAAPAEALFLLGEHKALWLTGFALTSFFTLIHQGPIFAVALSLARLNMRALATSIIVFCAGLLGQVVGPLLVGFLNDRLHPAFGDQAIRYSLLIIAICAVGGGLAFFAAARFIEGDIQRIAEAPGKARAR